MTIKKMKIKRKNSDGYHTYYPETSADQVIDLNSNKNLSQIVSETTQQLAQIDKNVQTRSDKAKMMGHRGLSAVFPENTIPSWIGAAKVDMFGVEGDFSSTSDGVWCAMHNDTVDAYTDGTGRVTDLTYAQIQSLTVDNGNNIAKYPNLKVPTLDDFLQVCKTYNLTPLIEIKNVADPSHYQILLDKIIAWGFEYKCIILCLKWQPLKDIRALNKNVKLAFNTVLNEVDGIASGLSPNSAMVFSGSNVTKAAIDYCHSKNIEVLTMIVDDYAVAEQHAKWGADYIITNRIVEVF